MSTHDAYFNRLQAALQAEGELLPRLIVDLDRLDHNIDQAVAFAAQAGKALRLVEKSLPSFQLLDYIARRAGTRRLMSFTNPFSISTPGTGRMPTSCLASRCRRRWLNVSISCIRAGLIHSGNCNG